MSLCILPLFFSTQTGVYNEDNNGEAKILEHCPRDFLPVEAKLQEPSLTVKCVLEAIHTIYRQENFSWGIITASSMALEQLQAKLTNLSQGLTDSLIEFVYEYYYKSSYLFINT